MGSLFRSEEVQLSQLFLHIDSAYMCISELGELGLVQFRDSVPEVNAFQRKFVNEIRRCEEMERKLRFLETEIKKDGFPITDTGENPEAPAPREMIDLEATFEKLENGLKEVNSNAEQLKKTYSELTELKQILRKTQVFFEGAMHDSAMTEANVGLLGDDALRSGVEPRLGFVAGVVLRERLPAFERMLWRACRGNVFLKQAEIETPLEDPATGDKVYKSVFIIFFQGDQLRSRVKKICEGFHAIIYPCPDNAEKRREMAISVMGKTEDLETVLQQTRQHRQRVLETAAKNLRVWFIKVRKIRAIYHTLDLFNLDVTTKCMIGECWCAVNDLDRIHMALRRGMERSNSTLQPILNGLSTTESPPTYHRTNRFTAAFQTIVDAYGVAKYREVNPALFTIITFPFLFAVMFGDAGHGLIMFLFALWMVLFERTFLAQKSSNEIWNMFFGGRYIILLMGIFSIYTGMVYNDIFSRSTNIFGSSWMPAYGEETLEHNELLQLEPRTINRTNDRMFAGYPYPFGIDPIWQLSKNKIAFTNSIKMKMSIIIGVIHMLFGVSLSAFNHKFYNDRLSIWCEFIPQIIFLSSIFGYLVILVFYKWLAYGAEDSKTAPSLLLTLINMVRFSYSSKGEFDPAAPFYSAQPGLQSFLVILALICVPWMLLSKPLIMRRRHLMRGTGHNDENVLIGQENGFGSNSGNMGDTASAGSEDPLHPTPDQQSQKSSTGGHGHGDEKFDFGEIMVHQTIHTIEYCLGCVSNTASYLRLWALSLAHAQLSEVVWSMVLSPGLKFNGYAGSVMIFFAFFFWAFLTCGILLIMEGLSAFLHALRLHWVEFNNKFYSGTGYLFQPFSFETYTNVAE